jgi:steroid 5-alpha reductase family enzyme
MLSLIFTNLALLLGVFVIVWLISVRMKDASIVDILWGPACAASAVFTYLRADVTDPRAAILTGLVVLWGARLGIYLGMRNLGHGEDYRYQLMRQKVGDDKKFVWWSLRRVFVLQCVIAWFISLPTQVGQIGGSTSLGALAYLGIIVFAIGLIFEAVGDYQLRKFKSDPANKGKLMTQGLWGWTRHPNYFGDAAVWTGLTLIALEAPWGWTTLLSPAVMIFFLYAVSGKAMLERGMDQKYPEYADYKKRVSGFIPWPPKKA